MLCPGHSLERHALARYCVECGGEIARRSESAAQSSYVIEHDPATLMSYLGIACLVSREATLHCLDSELHFLNSTQLQPTTDSPSLSVAEGYLYLSAPWGVRCLDLVALLQSTAEDTLVLTTEPAVTPVVALGDAEYWVSASNRLSGWINREASFEVRIPELARELPVLTPSITGEHALIVQSGGRNIHIVDLQAKKARPKLDAGGRILYAVPTVSGISALVETKEGRRIISATAAGVTTAVAALNPYVTWITFIPGTDRYIWGDGSQCFVQTRQGTRALDVNGNVGMVKVQDGFGWGLVESAENSTAIVIDLGGGQIKNSQALGGRAFSDFSVSEGRFIASNGHEVRSVNLQ